MKTNSFFLPTLLRFCLLPVLILGCASSTRLTQPGQKPIHHKPVAVDTLRTAGFVKDSAVTADSFVSQYSGDVPAAPDKADIDFLIESAKEYCQSDSFASAHSLLRKALAEIKEKSETDSGPAESEAYYEQIAGIYTDKMPSEYGDSLPDEISILVFQKQMSRSLDTLRLSPNDSVIMKKLTCQKGVSYNFPIVWNDRVYRSLYFFSRGRKGPLDKWLERAVYYLPFMQRMFADSGMPTDLAYLPLIESGFNPLAYSRARASGIWQFIASTGTLYGLRKNYWLDERRDPVKSTGAAISYLKKLHVQFGDWQLALASYNCGENQVASACSRASSASFWQLRLPRETRNYVPEFISALIVAKNPQCFGYSPDTSVTFNLDTMVLDHCLNMHVIADSLGIDERELHALNPHIMHWCTPPNAGQVHLFLPQGTKEKLAASLALDPDAYNVVWYSYEVKSGQKLAGIARQFKVPLDALKSVNSLTASNRLATGQSIFIPIPLHMSTTEATVIAEDMLHNQSERHMPLPDKGGAIRYRVRRGDTVWELARLFHTTAGNISSWNGISSGTRLVAGQILVLYSKSSRARAVTDSPAAVAPPQASKRVSAGTTYEVQKGETLFSISRKLGVSTADLAQWNGLDGNKPIIYAGEKLTSYAVSSVVRRPQTAVLSDTVLYRVCRGDNLSSLAQSFSVSVNDLAQANNLSAFAPLRVGAVLRIPMGKRPT